MKRTPPILQNFLCCCSISFSVSLTWNDQIDLCADSLYLKITKKTPGEIFPNIEMEDVNA